MLSESLLYFSSYTSIVQVDKDIYSDSTICNYSDDKLLYMLGFPKYLNLCKRLVHLVSDKSMLERYMEVYCSDTEWVKLLVSLNVKYSHRCLFQICCKNKYLETIEFILDLHIKEFIDDYDMFDVAYGCGCGLLDVAKRLLSIQNDKVTFVSIALDNNVDMIEEFWNEIDD